MDLRWAGGSSLALVPVRITSGGTVNLVPTRPTRWVWCRLLRISWFLLIFKKSQFFSGIFSGGNVAGLFIFTVNFFESHYNVGAFMYPQSLFENIGPCKYQKKLNSVILRSEITDFHWAGGFSLALVPIQRTSGEPSTWFPLGQLVQSDFDCFGFLHFLWNCWESSFFHLSETERRLTVHFYCKLVQFTC